MRGPGFLPGPFFCARRSLSPVACGLPLDTRMPISLARLFTLVIFLAAPAVLGCATPGPLVRLDPTSPAVFWVSGRATVAGEEGGVKVAAAFEHQDGETLGLRVEVQNGSEGPIDVDPRDVSFTTCATAALASCATAARAIDPEQMLAALKQRQSREQADAANSQALLGALVILSAVADVATVASGHANHHTGNATFATAVVMENDAAARNTSLASLAVQQSIWTNEALRRSTLVPGAGAAGRIYVPIDLAAQFVWLHVRSGGHVFSFQFRQTVTRVDPPSVPAGGYSNNG